MDTVSEPFLLPVRDPARSGPSHPWGVVHRYGRTLSMVKIEPFRTKEEANAFRETILNPPIPEEGLT